MRTTSIGGFLKLFPEKTRRHFRLAVIVSTLLAFLDFLSLVLLFPVFSVLASGSSSSAASKGTTRIFGGADPQVLVFVAMGVMIVRTVAGFVFRFWWGQMVAEAEVSLSSRLLSAYAYAPYAFHLRRNSADLLARSVSHVNMATGSGLNGLVLLATDAATVFALSAALFVANPIAAALLCLYLAAVGGLFLVISKKFVAGQTRRFSDEVARVYRRATTVLRGIRELTVAGGRDTVLRSIENARSDMVRAQRNMLVLTDVPRVVLEVALYSAILAALYFVLNGKHSDSSLPVVALYIVAGLRILPAIARGLGNLTQARTGVELGTHIQAEFDDVNSSGQQEHLPAESLPRRGKLALNGLAFAYDGGETVFQDVNLEIPFGAYLAIVGPSGAGKSTLLGIILGLLRPTTGNVTYGGASVGLADPEWLRHVGYVPQDVFLLDDTVLANVALGDDHPDPARVWKALERAALAETIGAMSEGLQTNLGEGGSRLSVGQRQRLGISRALYRDPAVLILDEPTAALDPDTEAQVMDTVNALAGSITIILVAHRLETIRGANSIVKVDGGKVSEVAPSQRRAVRSDT